MASLFQARALVLSRREAREVDRWYSALSRDIGKIEFMARGGQKPLAKLTPHLESIAEVELLLVQGRYYFTVAGVERRRAFPKLSSDLSKLLLAQSGLHLVDIGTRPLEADPFLYKSLLYWLKFLEVAPALSKERSAFLLAAFSLKLMAIIGYRPELLRCLACKRELSPGAFRWHALKGGAVCTACVRADEAQWFAARPLADSTLKLLRFALSESYPILLRPKLPAETLTDFHTAVESLIVSHFPTIPANSLRESCLVC